MCRPTGPRPARLMSPLTLPHPGFPCATSDPAAHASYMGSMYTTIQDADKTLATARRSDMELEHDHGQLGSCPQPSRRCLTVQGQFERTRELKASWSPEDPGSAPPTGALALLPPPNWCSSIWLYTY